MKSLKKKNLFFVLASILMVVTFTILSKQWSNLAAGLYTYINLWFLLMKKDTKISFLRCRVCLVYVWFGFIAFWNILYLILLLVGTGAAIASESA